MEEVNSEEDDEMQLVEDGGWNSDGEGEQQQGGQMSWGLQMNWNICKYLPEAGSCQEMFKVCTVYAYVI